MLKYTNGNGDANINAQEANTCL